MDARSFHISQPYHDTFRWIYNTGDHEFAEWLQHGIGTFWITGKAGSGKSTLMKFLTKDPRTMQLLRAGTGIASFFFHEMSLSPLLKTHIGLFRAMLNQILFCHLSLISVAFPDRWEALSPEASSESSLVDENPWTLAELEDAMLRIVAQQGQPLRLLLLIDGLDEFDGDDKDTVRILSNFAAQQIHSCHHIQVCLSSRPLPVFKQSFSQCPHLRIHEFTRPDIERFVTGEFEMHQIIFAAAKQSSFQYRSIVWLLVDRAQGIFQWVKFVVASVIRGMRGADTVDEIYHRIHSLPSSLEGLYEKIINEIELCYREQASKMMLLLQNAVCLLTPLGLWLAERAPILMTDDAGYQMTELDIQRVMQKVAGRVIGRCGGLMETSEGHGIEHGPADLSWMHDAPEVRFAHLTVKKFLQTPKMQE